MRVYLDNCCLSRPFDKQDQERVRRESEAILAVLQRVRRGEWTMVTSDAVDAEIAGIRDSDRRGQVAVLTSSATEHVRFTPERKRRGGQLDSLGFRGYDSLHIACAEAAGADVLLTTDDRFVRRARRVQGQLGVHVANPLAWLEERGE